MRRIAFGLLAALLGFAMSGCHPAYVQVGTVVGPEPLCPYGYFDLAPYDCAPFGYYGPEWFVGGSFIGAGPWFRGDRRFRGYVDNRFHPAHGYRGTLPARGERPQAGRRADGSNFHGNEQRDGRGHATGHRR
ncbi:MAG TPA: hypothetical protein VG871_20755 [Vicinamibacterales bacterium]|nr:hypothetical protein [Vicinamibacterales bacterium]